MNEIKKKLYKNRILQIIQFTHRDLKIFHTSI